MSSNRKKAVSLVLGSGGARGLAHIGVIRYLEERDFDICSISGCSMGAVVGGIYAAGKLAEYEKWVCAIDRMDIVSLLDFSWTTSGLVKGEKIIDTLRDLVGERDIEDLPISFTAVATDIGDGREVWLRSGSLFQAMRASMSLPLLFTPANYNGRALIDGGVLNPVPMAPTFSDQSDLTIAVDLNGRATAKPEPAPETASDSTPIDDDETSALRGRIGKFLDSLGERMNRSDAEESDDLDARDVANQAFDAMQSAISRQQLAAYPPDRLITIPRSAASVLEFDRAKELIDMGYREAERQLSR